MLTNQSIPKPIRVLVGPEVFFGHNPLGINMEHMIAFQRVIVPSGMFRFDYIAFQRSEKYGHDQQALVHRLKDAGIQMDALFTTPKAPFEKTQQFFRELMFQCDVVFPTEVLSHFALTPLLRHRYEGSRQGFVAALATQCQTAAEWNFANFCEFARNHRPPTAVGPKAYRHRIV